MTTPKSNVADSKIEVDSVGPLTGHTKAIYEAGKDLVIDSIATGREFCKFLITATVGGIPVYLGFATFLLPEHFRPALRQAVVLVAPPLVFLTASVIAAYGYLPRRALVSLDVVDEIRGERDRLIRRRRKFGIIAFVLFMLGTVIAIANLILIVYGVVGPPALPKSSG